VRSLAGPEAANADAAGTATRHPAADGGAHGRAGQQRAHANSGPNPARRTPGHLARAACGPRRCPAAAGRHAQGPPLARRRSLDPLPRPLLPVPTSTRTTGTYFPPQKTFFPVHERLEQGRARRETVARSERAGSMRRGADACGVSSARMHPSLPRAAACHRVRPLCALSVCVCVCALQLLWLPHASGASNRR